MTEPKPKTLQLLQLPPLAEFIQNNSTDLIKLLELEPNKFTHMFTLEYDYDIAINNKVKKLILQQLARTLALLIQLLKMAINFSLLVLILTGLYLN